MHFGILFAGFNRRALPLLEESVFLCYFGKSFEFNIKGREESSIVVFVLFFLQDFSKAKHCDCFITYVFIWLHS